MSRSGILFAVAAFAAGAFFVSAPASAGDAPSLKSGADAKAAVAALKENAAASSLPAGSEFRAALRPEEMDCRVVRADRENPPVAEPFALRTRETALHCPPRVRRDCWREVVAEHERSVVVRFDGLPPAEGEGYYAATVCLVRNRLSVSPDAGSAAPLAFSIEDDGARAVVTARPAARSGGFSAAYFGGRRDRCWFTGMTEPRREGGAKLCRYACGDGDTMFLPPADGVSNPSRACLPFVDRGHLPR
jgi:hypothetical protein